MMKLPNRRDAVLVQLQQLVAEPVGAVLRVRDTRDAYVRLVACLVRLACVPGVLLRRLPRHVVRLWVILQTMTSLKFKAGLASA